VAGGKSLSGIGLESSTTGARVRIGMSMGAAVGYDASSGLLGSNCDAETERVDGKNARAWPACMMLGLGGRKARLLGLGGKPRLLGLGGTNGEGPGIK